MIRFSDPQEVRDVLETFEELSREECQVIETLSSLKLEESVTVLPGTIQVPHYSSYGSSEDRDATFNVIQYLVGQDRDFSIQIRNNKTLFCFGNDWLPRNPDDYFNSGSYNIKRSRVCGTLNLKATSPPVFGEITDKYLEQCRKDWGIVSNEMLTMFNPNKRERDEQKRIGLETFVGTLNNFGVEDVSNDYTGEITVGLNDKIIAHLSSVLKIFFREDGEICYILRSRIVFLFTPAYGYQDIRFQSATPESGFAGFVSHFRKQFKFIDFKKRKAEVKVMVDKNIIISKLDEAIAKRKSFACIFALLDRGLTPDCSTLNLAEERDDIDIFKLILSHCTDSPNEWSLRTTTLENWLSPFSTSRFRGPVTTGMDKAVMKELEKSAIERKMFHRNNLDFAMHFLVDEDEDDNLLSRLKSDQILASQILKGLDLKDFTAILKLLLSSMVKKKFSLVLLLETMKRRIPIDNFQSDPLPEKLFWPFTASVLDRVCNLGVLNDYWTEISAFCSQISKNLFTPTNCV